MWFLLQVFPSEKWQGKFKRHFIYPLLTTAVWPNLLTSRCRLGFGKIFHSSQAERQNTKHISNNMKSFRQNTCEVYFNHSRINQLNSFKMHLWVDASRTCQQHWSILTFIKTTGHSQKSHFITCTVVCRHSQFQHPQEQTLAIVFYQRISNIALMFTHSQIS